MSTRTRRHARRASALLAGVLALSTAAVLLAPPRNIASVDPIQDEREEERAGEEEGKEWASPSHRPQVRHRLVARARVRFERPGRASHIQTRLALGDRDRPPPRPALPILLI